MADGAAAVGAPLRDASQWADAAGPDGTRFGAVLGDAAQGMFRSPAAFWGFAAVMAALVYLLVLVFPFVELLAIVRHAPMLIASVVIFLFLLIAALLLFVVAPLAAGFSWSVIQVMRGGRQPPEGWRIGFERRGRVAGLALMTFAPLLVGTMLTLVLSAWLAVPLSGAGGRSRVFLFLLPTLGALFVVPALLLLARWSLAVYALMDLDLSVADGLAASWSMTRGRSWTVLGLCAVLGLVHAFAGLFPPATVLSLVWMQRSFVLLYERTRAAIPTSIEPVMSAERTWIDEIVIRHD